MKKLLLAPLLFLIVFVSCTKEQNDLPPYGTLTINITHAVDGKNLYFDTLIYYNADSEKYELSKLQYYISNIKFYREGREIYASSAIKYVDARNPITTLIFDQVPNGSIDKVTYSIGIDAIHNIQGNLPNTAENVNMEWPTLMGGGYHFMKMEGYWKKKDSLTMQQLGFTVHLGSNNFLVNGRAYTSNFNIYSGNVNAVYFRMNVNEWFKDPSFYSWDKDGNYTMGVDSLMQKIMLNGYNVYDIYQ